MSISDSQPPGGPQGWIGAAVVAVIGAVGGLWAIIRKDKGSAITHLNRVIKGHEQYAKTLEERVASYQKQVSAAEHECRLLKSELTAMTLERDLLARRNADHKVSGPDQKWGE